MDYTKLNTSELRPYLDAGWQLIPLHSHDYFDEHRGKRRERGKSPLHGNWTRRPYKSKDQVKHMKGGQNVGVRLRAGDLVVDVDPRNFKKGDDPFKRLLEDCGMDLSGYPTVETGRGDGGLHIYMTKPADVSVRDSLKDYEGVEFKTLGRQVVSAGSLHPVSKKIYAWDFLSSPLKDAMPAPTKLINLIRRPSRSLSTGGGEHTQEELATMLDGLEPEDFSNHDEWFTLMQACHHATAGDGRMEFIEWCTRDPEYSSDGGIIGRRWDSLHADNGNGPRVTYRTLHKLLLDADAGDCIPRKPASDDFELIGPEDLPDDAIEAEAEEHEKKGPLERMNDKYWAVMEGAQFKIFWEQVDPSTAIPEKNVPPRKRWIKAKVYDFNMMLSNRRVQAGKKTVPISEAWLEWGNRRSAQGVVFDPEHDHKGFLNLWTGWGYEPRKGAGSWDMLDELLFEVLCDGDDDVYEYVMNWAAYMIQHPGRPAEVAICFQGGKGVGKGTWGRALASLAGKHGMQITSSDQLTGRFNDHLRDVILLFADEALKPYDKDGESRLKGLITEPRIAYEGKGRDIITDRNMLHVVMASNEDWFIPAGLEGERRFMMQRANRKWVGNHDKFQRLHDELHAGGYSALLWELMQRDIKGWAPRQDIPTTQAFVEQKLRNMAPVPQWWFNVLTNGTAPADTTRDNMDWVKNQNIRIFRQDMRDSFDDHCRKNGIRNAGAMGRSVDMMFAQEIQRLVPNMKWKLREPVPDDRPDINPQSDGRTWAVQIPCLAECRDAFDTIIGTKIKW